jgi:hypothetical protein
VIEEKKWWFTGELFNDNHQLTRHKGQIEKRASRIHGRMDEFVGLFLLSN